MKTLSTISVLSLFSLAAFLHAEKRPNILLVMADDMGWYDIGW